jgi:DNA-binding NarL/FixJ family response regulator
VKKEKPDLPVQERTMPDMNGLEVMHAIRTESLPLDVLVLTMQFSEELSLELLRSGALGCVLTSDVDTELLAAVDHVRHPQPLFTSRLATSMAQSHVRSPGDDGVLSNSPLTPGETEVVKLLAEGKSNKEAARRFDADDQKPPQSHHAQDELASFSELIRSALRRRSQAVGC